VFEAVSNAVYAIEDRFGTENVRNGRVTINVSDLGDSEKIEIIVADDGVGLDQDRYKAFCETDTDFKRAKGGKGVGRLFGLDAFKDINVESNYRKGKRLLKRAFAFELNNDEQIVPSLTDQPVRGLKPIGTTITFRGLRTAEYADSFPRRADTFLRYFSAHFISDFLLGAGPRVFVDLDGQTAAYPDEIAQLTMGRPLKTGEFSHPDFGNISIVGFTCRPEASTGLDGNHQLHLLANGRTVESRKIDNLLGFRSINRDGETDLVFHGCVSAQYLDIRVNEGRTAFNLPERTLKNLSRVCMDKVRESLLPEQTKQYEKKRREKYQAFIERHPIYGFDDDETQLKRVPFHATSSEEFAAGLVKFQIRREESRQDTLQALIDAIDLGRVPENFQETVVRAARDIQSSEQLALAQHVVRRKLALELMERLIRRIRTRAQGDDHHLESTLHSFICPMRVRGDDPSEKKSRAHDLWIVDERLAFTRAFSSDKRLDAILTSGGSSDRPDLLVWDLAYGLGVTDPDVSADSVDVSEPLRKVMIVEFKRPGRRNYNGPEDQLEHQITKYLAQLKSGEIESFDRARVRIASDCVFYCYVVADIVGDLELQLSNWETTASGLGRIRPLKNQYRGSIEVIQWQDLINEAWLRNRAMLHAAGLSRSRLTELASGGAPKSDETTIVDDIDELDDEPA
jgi:hypothetical protein